MLGSSCWRLAAAEQGAEATAIAERRSVERGFLCFFGVLCVRRGGDLYERGASPLVGGLLLPCGCDQEKAKISSGEPNQGAP